MKPYISGGLRVLLVLFLLNPPVDAAANSVSSKSNVPKLLLGSKLAVADPATVSGLSHLYNLEYDKAIADFERSAKLYPEDPFAVNHLLQAVLLKELYRLNALDTTLYAQDGFLAGSPLPADPKVRERIFKLADSAAKLADRRLHENPDDVDALYARGVARGLRLSYSAIVEKSFFPSLRGAVASRTDHERVLALDPDYVDAKLVIGIHNFVIGSMPFPARLFAGMAGISGNKKRGIALLYEVGNAKCESSADARTALALFLRREGKYEEALEVMRSLVAQYPRNFIYALEEANLLKDGGNAKGAAQVYARVLQYARQGIYADPHLDRITFGLAESLRGMGDSHSALDNYEATLRSKTTPLDVRQRALLGAAQMLDVTGHRELALLRYQDAIDAAPETSTASIARRYLDRPFSY
jgi:tetratricopeptide (TPR) repeat protein